MQVSTASTRRGLAPSSAQTRCTRARNLVCHVQARRTNADPSPEILTAFFYGRALATLLNKRLSEAVIDFVSDVSKAMAERPQRIAEFQEEVVALARQDMSTSGYLPDRTTGGSGSSAASGGSSAAAGGSGANKPVDPQAAIDDLRAEIAYARASLNEIRAKQRASASQN